MNKPPRQNEGTKQKQPSEIIHAQQTTIYKGQLPPPDMLENLKLYSLDLLIVYLKW
jgi:hypothetical protein